MNGREIEHLLSLIEENTKANTKLLRSEVFGYMLSHEDEVVAQLRRDARAQIPTSFGDIVLHLSDLQKAIA